MENSNNRSNYKRSISDTTRSSSVGKSVPRNRKRGRHHNQRIKNDASRLELERAAQDNVSVQDPFWYAEDATAVANMASFPFNKVIGSPIASTSLDRVPAMLVARYYPALGGEAGPLSPYSSYINKAADAYFQYVVQGFTGSGIGFQSADLIMSAIAGANLFAMFEIGRRAYGMMHYYTQLNRYYAKNMVEALGFDFDDLVNNAAEFRSTFNILVSQANNTLVVPKGFKLYDRWKFINSKVFMDAEDPVIASTYAYVPAAYVIYSPVTAKTGTSLIYKTLSTNLTVQSYLATLNNMLRALNDDDVREMFGALRRVYSPDMLVKTEQIELDFLQPIERHDVVAMQFHNMRFANGTVAGLMPPAIAADGKARTDAMLYQDTEGHIRATYGVATGNQDFVVHSVSLNNEMLLDLYGHMANAANVLDATANMQVTLNQTFKPTDTSVTYNYTVCRTEIISSMVVAVASVVQDVDTTIYNPIKQAVSSITYNNTEAGMATIQLSHISSHPYVMLVESDTKAVIGYLGEIDKYTHISSGDMVELHGLTQYTLLSLPTNNRTITR
nr:putative capsid [Marmot picobirnavirus]